MQLPVKYKENFDVSSQGPSASSGVTLASNSRAFAQNVEILLTDFSGSCMSTNESLLLWPLPIHWHRQFMIISNKAMAQLGDGGAAPPSHDACGGVSHTFSI
jgi:hypothetical protein